MLLNCALVSGLLFVSVVLAEFHPENQQPPLLNHPEKSVDPTPLFPYINDLPIAGAEWIDRVGPIKYASCKFTVPGVYSSIPMGFDIIVRLGGFDNDCSLDAGIEVLTNGSGVNYRAWGEWYPGKFGFPREFSIIPGDVITASVEVENSTTGHVLLFNHVTEVGWGTWLSGQACNITGAFWIISAIPDRIKIPNFHVVSFTDIRVGTSMTHREPTEPEDGWMHLWNIKEDNQKITSVVFERDFVIIRHGSGLESG